MEIVVNVIIYWKKYLLLFNKRIKEENVLFI